MSEVVVVAEIGVLPEKREEALTALERLCSETHAKDAGCQLYALHLDPADEGRVIMVEKWDSAEALQAHGDSDHIRAFRESGTLSGAPTITVLTAAAFGDADKGIL